jgi:hypothetical protein
MFSCVHQGRYYCSIRTHGTSASLWSADRVDPCLSLRMNFMAHQLVEFEFRAACKLANVSNKQLPNPTVDCVVTECMRQ